MTILRFILCKMYGLTKIRVLYSLYFNFRYLPFSTARKLPIIIHNKAIFRMIKGAKVVINPDIKKKIHIGKQHANFSHRGTKTTIVNSGAIVFHGGDVFIRAGTIIKVFGQLHLHNQIIIGENTKIFCHNLLDIREKTWFSHECQVFDTNFHPIKELVSEMIPTATKPILIGERCWIGNRTSIMPGSVLPDFTIVGSNSLVNKDYSTMIEPYSLIAGTPAKLIKTGVIRVSHLIGDDWGIKIKEIKQNRDKNRGIYYGQEV